MTIAEQVQEIFEQGYRQITVTLKDGRTQKRRLFSRDKMVCVYNYQSKNWGKDVRSPIVTEDWASVKAAGKCEPETLYEWFLKNLNAYKRSFTARVHPNLWYDYQKGYSNLSIDAYKAYIEGSQTDVTNASKLREALREYCALFNIENVIWENNYKYTSVRSHAPVKYTDRWQYDAYIQNISRHLENKEEFNYKWKSRYNISVSGGLGGDGVYRAWMSLEPRGNGDIHYYLLVNDNAAVFTESD